MSGKQANNHPGLRLVKGQQPGLRGNTRARDQLSTLSLNASKTHDFVKSGRRLPTFQNNLLPTISRY
jgi:hypothetical protein